MNLDKSNSRRGHADTGRHEKGDLPHGATAPDANAWAHVCGNEPRKGQVRTGDSDIGTFRLALVHELRTPLQIMSGHLEALLAQEVSPTTVSSSAQDARLAPGDRLRAMRHVLDLATGAVEDVLRLGDGDVSRLPLREAVFEVRACLDEAVVAFAGAAHSKGLCLTCDIADDVPALLHGDAVRLGQILRTLLDNALKFTACGGVAVTVSWRRERAGAAAEDSGGGLPLHSHSASGDDAARTGRLVLYVSDTGPGIPVGMENAVFAAFARVDRSVAGSGLGLWIARQWAQRMHGSLRAESPASGARFCLSVPFRTPGTPDRPDAVGTQGTMPPKVPVDAAEPVPVPVAHVDVRPGLRALVVDDHIMNRVVVTERLSSLGCIVDQAQDLTEALSRWAVGDYDVVLTDVQLGGACGLTLARALDVLSKGLGRPRPVVFALTGSVVSARRAREAGIDEVLTKPVTGQRLAQVLAVRWPDDGVAPENVPRTHGISASRDVMERARPPGPSAWPIAEAAGGKPVRQPLREDPYARRLMREEMAKDLARFRRLVGHDPDAAQRLLHRMRGACRMFGDPALTARCDRLAEKLANCRQRLGWAKPAANPVAETVTDPADDHR